jgi:membrane-associated PAP2 superfamily phosphatase
VLWAFAVAQPLFDDLGRNAEFFVARHNTATDILILSVVLTLVPPLALFAVELVASVIWRPLGHALHVVFVGVLGAVVAVGVLKRMVPDDSVVLVPAAAAAGTAIGTGVART